MEGGAEMRPGPTPLFLCSYPSFVIYSLSLGRLDSAPRSEVRLQLQPTLSCP